MSGWWFIYIVRCCDGSLYTGATNDLRARLAKHNEGKGARYTRARLPVELVWRCRVSGRSLAFSLEAGIKRLSRKEKLLLVTKRRRLSSLLAR
jgi:putative endonuclease